MDALFTAEDFFEGQLVAGITCVAFYRVPGDRRRLRAGQLRPAGHRRRTALGRRQRRGVRRQLGIRDAVWSRRRSRPSQPAHTVATRSRSTTVMFNLLTNKIISIKITSTVKELRCKFVLVFTPKQH